MNNLVSENINIEFWSKGYDIAAKNVYTIAEYIANQLRKEQWKEHLVLENMFKDSR